MLQQQKGIAPLKSTTRPSSRQDASRMKSKLADYSLSIGLAFLLAGLFAKELPHYIGSRPVIQFPCAFFGSVFLPLGSLLSLCNLVFQPANRRKHLGLFLVGLAFLPLLLAFYFSFYVTVDRSVKTFRTMPNSGILAVMLQNMQKLPTQNQREQEAALAYELYGTILVYPRDDGQLVYFVPTMDDKVKHRDWQNTESKTQKSLNIIDKTIAQLPYLFALYLSTYTAAFLAGGIWLYFKIPKSIPAPAP